MLKNQIAIIGKKGNNFKDVSQILNNPSDRAKLQNYVDEAVRCKVNIADEQASIKTLRDSAVDELGIEPKMFNTMVSLFFNNNFDQKKTEIEKMDAMLEHLTMYNPAISADFSQSTDDDEPIQSFPG